MVLLATVLTMTAKWFGLALGSLLLGCGEPGAGSALGIPDGIVTAAAGAPANGGGAAAGGPSTAPASAGASSFGGGAGASSPDAGGGGSSAGGGGAAGAPAAGSAGGAATPVDHGDEYVWIDQDFHWSEASNANVTDTGPVNWYSDEGRDYYAGKVEFRVTVRTKADGTPVWHELCHWQNSLGDPAHVCLHCLPLYTSPGEYSCETSAAEQGGPVDYHEPFVAVQNRVKDGSSGRGMDLITLKKGLPIDYHYTVVLVPAGQTFSGWSNYPVP